MADDSPTEISHESAELAAALAEATARERARVWSEPGALGRSDRPLDSGVIALQEPGSDDPARGRGLVARDVSDAELDRSLLGLDLASGETPAPSVPAATPKSTSSETPTQPSRVENSSDWLWYAAAAAILVLGLLGYVFR